MDTDVPAQIERAHGAQADAWLARAFDDAVTGVALVDGRGRLVRLNAALCATVRRHADELLGCELASLAHHEDRELVHDQLVQLLGGNEPRRRLDARLVRDGGELLQVRLHLSVVRGEVPGIVCQFEDVTERTEASARLRWQAFHDALTGLPNRALLLERLGHALQRAARRSTDLAVLFVDLDRFKLVNDSMGHDVGDELLREVAGRLTSVVRASDTVARLAGDEFVVLAEELTAPAEADVIAERIQRVLAPPMHLSARTVTVRASIGIAVPDGHDPEALLRDADTALYRAKERGRNRVERFDESLRLEAMRKLTNEEILRAALEGDGLAAHYQPIIDLVTGAALSCEALLRLPGPDGHLRSPGDFISIAEESGLIVQIGAGVLDDACRQLATWRRNLGAMAPVQVSVNVSSRQLSSESFAPLVFRVLARHGLRPTDLILEFTESVIVEADAQTARTVEALDRAGVTLAVDDFGTGYSSLSYLKRFPVRIVKLDRSFVDGLGDAGHDTEIVRAVLALGRALGLSVTAEGIETPEQLQALRELGCDHGQGYLLATPADPATTAQRLEAAPWRNLQTTLRPTPGATHRTAPGRA